jgi:hypothetical protein
MGNFEEKKRREEKRKEKKKQSESLVFNEINFYLSSKKHFSTVVSRT